MHNERPIGHWFSVDRLFEEAPKKESPEFRAASVEAKGELIEVRLEVIGLYGPLVGPEQPAFEEASDAVNPGQGHMGRIACGGYNMGPVEIGVPDSSRVRGQTIGDNDGPRPHALKQERAQRQCLGVGDDA
jgi:hypothetical protein